MSCTVSWDPSRLAHPRFARIADLVARIAETGSVAELDERLRPELATVGVRLVEAGKTRATLAADGTIDPASLYEVRIVERGEIPTRPHNTHDLCNALVWAAFPHAKLALSRALAAVQRSRAAGRATLPPTRSREHDVLALVDEGGVVCAGAATWIFGHALYEHAYDGAAPVRGTPIDLDVPADADRAAIDRALAAADLQRVVRRGPGIAVE